MEQGLTVAYLTLTWDPINMRHAIINVLNQDYPDKLKKLYLMCQEPYPDKIIHSMPFEIEQIDVPGKWGALWFLKLQAFSKVVKEDIVITWDEDDRFKFNYTTKALLPFTEFFSCDATYNHHSHWVKKSGFFYQDLKEPSGTLCYKPEILKKCLPLLKEAYPNLELRPNHPLDTPFRRMIESNYTVQEHKGERFWMFHSKQTSNLVHAPNRLVEEHLDHD